MELGCVEWSAHVACLCGGRRFMHCLNALHFGALYSLNALCAILQGECRTHCWIALQILVFFIEIIFLAGSLIPRGFRLMPTLWDWGTVPVDVFAFWGNPDLAALSRVHLISQGFYGLGRMHERLWIHWPWSCYSGKLKKHTHTKATLTLFLINPAPAAYDCPRIRALFPGNNQTPSGPPVP